MKKVKKILIVMVNLFAMPVLLLAEGDTNHWVSDTLKGFVGSASSKGAKSNNQPLISIGTSFTKENIEQVRDASIEAGTALIDKSKELFEPASKNFAEYVAPAVGEQVKKVAPNLDNNISKVSNSFTSFMSGIKCWPFLVLGAAVSIIGCKIFSDGRDKNRYADEKDHKVIQQSRLHMLEGGLAVVLGCLIMKFSKPLFYHFSE